MRLHHVIYNIKKILDIFKVDVIDGPRILPYFLKTDSQLLNLRYYDLGGFHSAVAIRQSPVVISHLIDVDRQAAVAFNSHLFLFKMTIWVEIF